MAGEEIGGGGAIQASQQQQATKENAEQAALQQQEAASQDVAAAQSAPPPTIGRTIREGTSTYNTWETFGYGVSSDGFKSVQIGNPYYDPNAVAPKPVEPTPTQTYLFATTPGTRAQDVALAEALQHPEMQRYSWVQYDNTGQYGSPASAPNPVYNQSAYNAAKGIPEPGNGGLYLTYVGGRTPIVSAIYTPGAEPYRGDPTKTSSVDLPGQVNLFAGYSSPGSGIISTPGALSTPVTPTMQNYALQQQPQGGYYGMENTPIIGGRIAYAQPIGPQQPGAASSLAGTEISPGVYLTGNVSKVTPETYGPIDAGKGTSTPFISNAATAAPNRSFAGDVLGAPAVVGAAIVAAPTTLFETGQKYQENINTLTDVGYGAIGAGGGSKSYANAALAFGSTVASTPTFVLSLPYGAQWAAERPFEVPGKAYEIGSGMVSGALEAQAKHPGAIVGIAAGLYVSGKILEPITPKVTLPETLQPGYISPIGIARADIPAAAGEAGSTATVLFTKPMFSPVSAGTVRAGVVTSSILDSARFTPEGVPLRDTANINLRQSEATFASELEANAAFEASAGKTGQYYHASANNPEFIQTLLQKGEFTVGERLTPEGVVQPTAEPLYFGAEGTLYKQFLGSRGVMDPNAAIIRVTEAPKTVEQSMQFVNTPEQPLIDSGLYPGPKPLTGGDVKFGLQQEYVVPAGTKMSVTNVGYTVIEGKQVPLIDVQIGGRGVAGEAQLAARSIDLKVEQIKSAEFFTGSPNEILRGKSIQMSSPLAVGDQAWTPGQRVVMSDYIAQRAAEPGAGAGLQVVAAGQEAVPLFKDTTFVQREPVGQILVEKGLVSEQTIGEVLANRAQYGNDVLSGGSTVIRANLGKGFFGAEKIGDIDAWTKTDVLKQLYQEERGIIAKDQPSVLQGREPGIDKQGHLAGAVQGPEMSGPITEMHTIEAFRSVTNPEYLGTMEGVGGAPVTGPNTALSGGVLKSSAMFDKQFLTQSPGGALDIKLNEAGVKHAVGASAVAKEAASLQYGRDVRETGMSPSYTKGQKLETYSEKIDTLLADQKGKTAEQVKSYQESIEQNPLELPETIGAKKAAYILENNPTALGQILGVDVATPMPKVAGESTYMTSAAGTGSSNVLVSAEKVVGPTAAATGYTFGNEVLPSDKSSGFLPIGKEANVKEPKVKEPNPNSFTGKYKEDYATTKETPRGPNQNTFTGWTPEDYITTKTKADKTESTTYPSAKTAEAPSMMLMSSSYAVESAPAGTSSYAASAPAAYTPSSSASAFYPGVATPYSGSYPLAGAPQAASYPVGYPRGGETTYPSAYPTATPSAYPSGYPSVKGGRPFESVPKAPATSIFTPDEFRKKPKRKVSKGKSFGEVFSFDVDKNFKTPERLTKKSNPKRFTETFGMDTKSTFSKSTFGKLRSPFESINTSKKKRSK